MTRDVRTHWKVMRLSGNHRSGAKITVPGTLTELEGKWEYSTMWPWWASMRDRGWRKVLCLSHVCAGRASRPSSKIPKAAIWLNCGVRQEVHMTVLEWVHEINGKDSVKTSRTIREGGELLEQSEHVTGSVVTKRLQSEAPNKWAVHAVSRPRHRTSTMCS